MRTCFAIVWLEGFAAICDKYFRLFAITIINDDYLDPLFTNERGNDLLRHFFKRQRQAIGNGLGDIVFVALLFNIHA